MGVGGIGHGVGGGAVVRLGGPVVGLGGLEGGDLLQGGVLVWQKGSWGELVGPWLAPDVTGHVVPIESGGSPRGWLIRWQHLRGGR